MCASFTPWCTFVSQLLMHPCNNENDLLQILLRLVHLLRFVPQYWLKCVDHNNEKDKKRFWSGSGVCRHHLTLFSISTLALWLYRNMPKRINWSISYLTHTVINPT